MDGCFVIVSSQLPCCSMYQNMRGMSLSHASSLSNEHGEHEAMEKSGLDHSDKTEPMPADYLCEFDDDSELTEAQRLELLAVLFDIMKSFVLMGYGMEPVNKLIETFENSARGEDPMVECEHDENGEGDA